MNNVVKINKARRLRRKLFIAPKKNVRRKRMQSYPLFFWVIFLLMGIAGLFIHEKSTNQAIPHTYKKDKQINHTAITCYNPYIIDGDTLICNNTRIRLAGIDAPEMNGYCRPGRKCVSGDPEASKKYLHEISRGDVTCNPIEIDHYGRTIAYCDAQSGDLSCSMLAAELATARYRPISC